MPSAAVGGRKGKSGARKNLPESEEIGKKVTPLRGERVRPDKLIHKTSRNWSPPSRRRGERNPEENRYHPD